MLHAAHGSSTVLRHGELVNAAWRRSVDAHDKITRRPVAARRHSWATASGFLRLVRSSMSARRRSQHTEVQICDLGASSYRAYVHLVAVAPGLDLFHSAVFVVSVDGPTLQKVLDAAIARVMTTIGTPVQMRSCRSTRNGRDRTPMRSKRSSRSRAPSSCARRPRSPHRSRRGTISHGKSPRRTRSSRKSTTRNASMRGWSCPPSATCSGRTRSPRTTTSPKPSRDSKPLRGSRFQCPL
jgi:hypothetical protein